MPGRAGIIADALGAIRGIVDDVHTSAEERLEAVRLAIEPIHATNLAEAQHASVFVAGWRPFIGWVLGVCLAYNFIVRDMIAWCLLVWGPADIPELPTLDMGEVIALTLSMLGVSGLRTIERRAGVERNSLSD